MAAVDDESDVEMESESSEKEDIKIKQKALAKVSKGKKAAISKKK